MTGENYVLTLYVIGKSAASLSAILNINLICEKYAKGRYSIEVIDLLENPMRAEQDQIFAVPTLVRKQPLPFRKLIGDLSNHAKVIAGLGMNSIMAN